MLSSDPRMDRLVILVRATEQVFTLPAFYKEFTPLTDEEVIWYLSGSASAGKQQFESLPVPHFFISAFPVSPAVSCI